MRRSNITKNFDSYENKSAYNFNVPLNGFSDYKGSLIVGDIIGVLLQSNTNTKVQFTTDKLYNVDLNLHVEPVFGSYYPQEEHFFSITKINKNKTKFEVKPVFIEGKVIRKLIEEKIEKSVELDINIFGKYEQLQEIYIENPHKNNISEKQKYNAFHYFQVNDFIEGITEDEVLKIPYKNYKNTLFNIWDVNYIDNLTKIIDYCMLHYPEKMDVIGTIELINQHMNVLLENIQDIKTIKCDILLHYNKTASMDNPSIKHNITKLKFMDIFRIYKSDSLTKLIKTREVTNWSGIIIPENSRKLVCPGNLLRFLIEGVRVNGCVYFTILHKISEKKFLACIKNIYCSLYEDVVVVLDTDAIHEIPVGWEENNESFAIYKNVQCGEGYAITGYREIKEKELIDMSYDGLIFS